MDWIKLSFFTIMVGLLYSCDDDRKQGFGSLYLHQKPAELHELIQSYPDMVPDAKAYMAGKKNALEKELLDKDGKKLISNWKAEGPYNLGGRINTIAIDPTDSDVYFVGFAMGGLWRTMDGGASYESIFDHSSSLSIGDIFIDPNDENTIYVGTGDPNITGLPGIGNGLWRSEDKGDTWENIGLEETYIISEIIIHPDNSDIIYVSTMGLPFVPNTDRGLYKSVDRGATWEQVLFINDMSGVTGIEIHPENPDMILASGWTRILNNTTSVLVGEGSKVFLSNDGGANWTETQGMGAPSGRTGIAMSASDPNIVYAVKIGFEGGIQGVFRSTNFGMNWSEVMHFGTLNNAVYTFGWYFGKLWVDPNNSDIVYIAGVGLYKGIVEENNTAIFTNVDQIDVTVKVHADKHELVFDGQGQLLLGTDGGLYKSMNDADSWIDDEFIPTNQFYRVAYNPNQPENYYGGMQDNGLAGGNAEAPNWPRIFGGDGFQMTFDPDNQDVFTVETQFGKIMITFNGGLSFNFGDFGIEYLDRKNFDMPYIQSEHDPSLYYTGTFKPYKGIRDFENILWEPIGEDLTDGLIYQAFVHTITTLDESNHEAGLLYYGTADGNLWRIMEGQEPVDITEGLPKRYISSVVCSENNPHEVFVSMTGFRDNDNSPFLYRSLDKGATWTDISGDLPSLSINDILHLNDSFNDALLVGTEGGVYVNSGSFEYWHRVGGNMPYVKIYDLDINVAESKIMAGTFGRGILSISTYSLIDPVFDSQDNVSDPEKSINVFPNPTYRFLNLYSNNINTEVQVVEIFDVQGKNVLTRKNNTPGRKIQIDLDFLDRGIYFIKVNGKSLLKNGVFVKI